MASRHLEMLYMAIGTNAVAPLREYHERGIDTFTCATSEGGSEPSICSAAALGRVNVIRLLHELGCDLNAVDVDGCTPVYCAACAACYGQQLEADGIRALCELGADVNIPDNDGQTPVHAAAQRGHVATIRILRELGADVNALDMNGVTPAFAAAANGQEKVMEALAQTGREHESAVSSIWYPSASSPARGTRCGGRETHKVYLSVRVLPQERHGRQAVCPQRMQEDVLLLCGMPEAGLGAAQGDVCCCPSPRRGLMGTLFWTFYCSTACQKQDWKQHKKRVSHPKKRPDLCCATHPTLHVYRRSTAVACLLCRVPLIK
jgi:hypothetical protein